MSIEELDFVKGFCRMCDDGFKQGWHERNGGHLTYLMDSDEVTAAKPDFLEPHGWVDLGMQETSLAGRYFLTTGSGKYMRNVLEDPAHNIGIVEINDSGTAYRIVWGLLNGAKPTSEFPTHCMNHAARLEVDPSNRVIYHSHTPGIIEMSNLVELDDRTFSRILWKMMTECVVVFPQGVGVVPWMVPGGVDIAKATSKLMKKYPAAVWAQHGLFASGSDFDTAFGLAHTIEKAAELYIASRAANGGSDKFLNAITDQNLKDTCRDFHVQINQDFVDCR